MLESLYESFGYTVINLLARQHLNVESNGRRAFKFMSGVAYENKFIWFDLVFLFVAKSEIIVSL